MYEYNLYSLRYSCTFSYSKNNSKFTRSLLKIYVCDVSNTLLSMKVKYVYGIQNRKYTGGAVQEKKAWNTVRVISYQFYLYINVISVLCNPQKQFCKSLLFLRDTREKCFLRYREPATLWYIWYDAVLFHFLVIVNQYKINAEKTIICVS